MQLNISENKSQNLNILAKVSHCSGHIWQNKAKSAICVVEDNSEDCVSHHCKKDGERQDPSLWDICISILGLEKRIPLWFLNFDNYIWPSLETDWISHLQHWAHSARSLSSISLQQPLGSPSLPCLHQQLLCFPYPLPFPKPGGGWFTLPIQIYFHEYIF